MKKILPKVLLAIVLLLVVIQFFRPERNSTAADPLNSIERHYAVPNEIGVILQTSCYDCHSNNTEYPWYSNVQPLAWWLQDHVNEGKRKLNFDEFNTYDAKKKKHKLDEVVEMIEEDEMPLTSYTLVHRDASLSPENKTKIINWARELQKTITYLHDRANDNRLC